MTEGRERILLTGALTDVAQAAALNERLRTDSIVFDWSEVERITDEAADALVRGLDLDAVADALGMATLREELANLIVAAFERASPGGPRRRKPKRGPSDGAPRPQVWADSSPPSRDAPLSQRSLGPSSSAPPAAPALLASEVPSEVELRAMLEQRVIDDLLGPAAGAGEEIADGTVRDRYLVGMLAPRRLRVAPEEVDRLELEEATSPEEDAHEDSNVAAPTMFPSAIGLSFAVPVGSPPLRAIVRWGNYRRLPSESLQTEKGNPKTVWKRRQIEETVVLPPIADGPFGPFRVGGDPDDALAPAQVRGVAHRVGEVWVVSLFLVNVQDEPEERRDEAWLFQPEIQVEAVDGSAVFCARVLDALPAASAEPREDDRRMAMLFRNRCELAVGHGVAVHAEPSPDDPSRAARIVTRVVPAHEVARQTAPTQDEEPKLRDVVHDMKELAESSTPELVATLERLAAAYADWIARQRARIGQLAARLGGFEQDAKSALDSCENALSRMRAGISLLSEDAHAADAFRFANRAMWLQRVHTVYAERRRQGRDLALEDVDVPGNRRWRTFQLAFVLLNLPGVTKLDHPERTDPSHAIADLLWFPTGGGKTEAYLGLAAYTMGLRRLQGTIGGRNGEHGVAVLMRYTLRLLTLQQFQRAAALMCACETLRREDEARWGRVPFRIGLWVGARSTPNKTEHANEALKRTRDVKFKQASRIGGTGSPVQLKACPWCGSTIEPGRHMRVEPFNSSTGRTLTFCGDKLGTCPFSERKAPDEGLPVLVVDEEVYRRLPALLIATVDKFAQMPWNGAVQMLFGQVEGYCARHGFTSPHLPDTDHKKRGKHPATKIIEHAPLRPPDLIIQDELHLISGPLGTLTGLYETAVDALCSWQVGGKTVRPKVVASTATIRRARDQIHALFLRSVEVFPPQGLDADDNFFARERAPSEEYGRRYIGICAPGRRLKAAVIRVYVAQLAAAKSLYDQYGTHADPWMTLVGYFSALRELAGTRRLVDDDISSRLRKMDRRGLARRFILAPEELTSRLDSTQIPELLDRLEIPFDPAREAGRQGARRPLDVLLATNMISVGVDVGRLGLMVVSGQPKNTAEYIQATSRVGRSHPGLVCTIYNWARPRDLSHFESFEHYHATFYNQVEALSVTPFAPRALDRGLSAVLVALVRLSSGRFNDNDGAARILRDDEALALAIQTIARRAALVDESKQTEDVTRALLERRIDEWLAAAEPKPGAGKLVYKAFREPTGRPLLEPAGLTNWKTFTCLGSLRDVEPTAELVLTDGGLDEEARPFGRRPE
jgi:hypothetical protein